MESKKLYLLFEKIKPYIHESPPTANKIHPVVGVPGYLFLPCIPLARSHCTEYFTLSFEVSSCVLEKFICLGVYTYY